MKASTNDSGDTAKKGAKSNEGNLTGIEAGVMEEGFNQCGVIAKYKSLDYG